jgi:hypothetical protein
VGSETSIPSIRLHRDPAFLDARTVDNWDFELSCSWRVGFDISLTILSETTIPSPSGLRFLNVLRAFLQRSIVDQIAALAYISESIESYKYR